MENINSGTVAGALEYLENLVKKGRMTNGGVQPLKTAITKIFKAVDGDKWSEMDIRSIDIDDYISRFGVMTQGNYTTNSLITYKSRLQKVIDWYNKSLSEPGWVPTKALGKVSTKKQVTKKMSPEVTVVPSTSSPQNPIKTYTTSSIEDEDFMIYPYPIRPGKLAKLYLPLDLKKSESKRLAAFIESLCLDNEE